VSFGMWDMIYGKHHDVCRAWASMADLFAVLSIYLISSRGIYSERYTLTLSGVPAS
jgi:hypothetical protein